MRHAPTRHLRRLALVLVATLAAPALLAPAPASAHGYTDNPPSRARLCQLGEVRDCGDAQYEPQSTEGEGNFPEHGPKDGQLCSAGIERFAELDATRTPAGAPWPTTRITVSGPFTFEWYNTAPHRTKEWRYYLTKPNYKRDRPLTRADLDLDNPLIIDGGGKVPPKIVEHTVKRLPDRSGRGMILSIWYVSDTAPPNYTAFYSCADVYFA